MGGRTPVSAVGAWSEQDRQDRCDNVVDTCHLVSGCQHLTRLGNAGRCESNDNRRSIQDRIQDRFLLVVGFLETGFWSFSLAILSSNVEDSFRILSGFFQDSFRIFLDFFVILEIYFLDF